MIALLALLACAPKAPLDRTLSPAALAPHRFEMPATSEAALSNGLRVVVVEGHEVPLAWVRVALVPGAYTDPAGKEGLASVTMDMLNEGAGARDAAALSLALKQLGSDLGAYAGDDGGGVWCSGLARNLPATLDLLADVLLRPTFPEKDWELLRKQRLADLDASRKNPDTIAVRVFDRVLFGDTYKGRLPSVASYAAITTADMRAWWTAQVTASNAIVVVGGDTTLASVQPLLESRLASWARGTPTPPPTTKPVAQTAAIHFVDRPGAAQTMLRVGNYVAAPRDGDWFDLLIANQALGGQFTSRLNMNLREDKGYTYGARSVLAFDHAGGRWISSAGVHSEVTAPALTEMMKEIREVTTGRPLAATEIEDARNAVVYAWPLRFENADYLLGQIENQWRYDLPADWIAAYPTHLGAVTSERAQAAWTTRIAPAPLAVVVVGDGAKIRASLDGFGLPVLQHDADGNLISQGVNDGH